MTSDHESAVLLSQLLREPSINDEQRVQVAFESPEPSAAITSSSAC